MGQRTSVQQCRKQVTPLLTHAEARLMTTPPPERTRPGAPRFCIQALDIALRSLNAHAGTSLRSQVLQVALMTWVAQGAPEVPDLAIVPRFLTRSSLVMPTPVSRISSVFFSLSTCAATCPHSPPHALDRMQMRLRSTGILAPCSAWRRLRKGSQLRRVHGMVLAQHGMS